jgi:hypothetical protein
MQIKLPTFLDFLEPDVVTYLDACGINPISYPEQ